MSQNRIGMLMLVGALSAGCNHATIETGLAPSTRKIENKWASGWIFGLVPPPTVETAERCPDGVARVDTERSFLNQIVGILTIGIYTPMSIVVTCAAGSAGEDAAGQATLQVDPDASMEEKQLVFQEAAALSAELGDAVYINF